MTINIQFERVPFNEVLTEYVIKKLNSLGDRYRVYKAQVLFKKDLALAGKGKICEIKVQLYGKGIVASASGSSYEKALLETTVNIEKQLKSKPLTHTRVLAIGA